MCRRTVWRYAIAAGCIGVAPLLCVLLMLSHNAPYSFALHGHLHADGSLLHVVQGQIARWGAGLWLYLTPPILLAAVFGSWVARRERMAWLPIGWALLGSLPVVLVPNRFFVPRHYLCVAIPVVILAAHGLHSLATALRGRLRAAMTRALVLGVLGLAVAPSVAADAAVVGAPATTPLIPADRFQYVTGWPSGYMLQPVVDYVRRQARR